MKLTISFIPVVGSLLCISPIFGQEKLQCKSNQECIKLRDCSYTKELLTRVLSSSDREEKNNMMAEMRKLVCNPLDRSVCCDKEESEAKADAKGDHEESDSKAEGNHEASEPEAQDDHETSDPEDSYPEAEGDHEESEAEAEGDHDVSNPEAKGDHEEFDAKTEGDHEASEPEAEDDHEMSDPEDSDPEAAGDHEDSDIEAEGDHEESNPEAEDDHEEYQPEYSGDCYYDSEASGDYYYDSEVEVEAKDDHEESEAVSEGSGYDDQNKTMDTLGRPIRCQILNPIVRFKRDFREDNSDHYGYSNTERTFSLSNPSPYNYCVMAWVGNHIIRGIGIPQFDPASLGITSDTCKNDFSPNIQTQLESDTVFDRICVCFSDNCNEDDWDGI